MWVAWAVTALWLAAWTLRASGQTVWSLACVLVALYVAARYFDEARRSALATAILIALVPLAFLVNTQVGHAAFRHSLLASAPLGAVFLAVWALEIALHPVLARRGVGRTTHEPVPPPERVPVPVGAPEGDPCPLCDGAGRVLEEGTWIICPLCGGLNPEKP
jgi:hypothetical protein